MAASDLHPFKLSRLTRRAFGSEPSAPHPLTSRLATVKPSGNSFKLELSDRFRWPLTRKLAGASPCSISFRASSAGSGESSGAARFRKRLKRIDVDGRKLKVEDRRSRSIYLRSSILGPQSAICRICRGVYSRWRQTRY